MQPPRPNVTLVIIDEASREAPRTRSIEIIASATATRPRLSSARVWAMSSAPMGRGSRFWPCEVSLYVCPAWMGCNSAVRRLQRLDCHLRAAGEACLPSACLLVTGVAAQSRRVLRTGTAIPVRSRRWLVIAPHAAALSFWAVETLCLLQFS